MKTNQIMVRPMGDFKVSQRICDGKFDCTSLLAQWNKANKNNIKKIGDYLRLKETKEFVKALMEEPEFKDGNSHLLEVTGYKDFPKSVVVVTRGKNGGTYMTPLMFLDFAMWLNPAFKVKVLKFVQDEMIRYRNEAGDAYKALAEAVSKLVGKDSVCKYLPNIAKAVNIVVFGEHHTMIRNEHGTELKQKELWALERKLADLVYDGFISTYEQLINYLRRKWIEKYQPKILKTND